MARDQSFPRAGVFRRARLPLFLMAAVLCASPAMAAERPERFADLDGCRIGLITGTVLEYIVNATLERTQIREYNTIDALLKGLRNGDIDCVVDNGVCLRFLVGSDARYRILPDDIRPVGFAMLFHDDQDELREAFDTELEAMLREGLVDGLVEKWLAGKGEASADWERYSGDRLVRLGVFDESPPFAFRDGMNNLVGIDVELVEHICRRLNYRLEVIGMPLDPLLDALYDGRLDVVASRLIVTTEREQLGDFGIVYFRDSVRALVRADP